MPGKALAKDSEASTELTSLVVASGMFQHIPLVWKGGNATLVPGTDNIYHVDVSQANSEYLRISGTRKSPTAEVSIVDMTDPENKSGVNLDIKYDKGYKLGANNKFVENTEGNVFCTLENDKNPAKFLKASKGSNVFKVIVKDGEKKKENYLIVSYKKSNIGVRDNWPDKINILNGKTRELLSDEYQYGNTIMTKDKGIGVCGEDGKCKIPDEISSIRLQLEKSIAPPKDAFYDGIEEEFYRTNSYAVSINGSPWKQIGGNEISEELPLKQGLNIIQLVTNLIEKHQESRRINFGSITLLLYREGDNTYEVPTGEDTSIKSVKIYQGADNKAHATDKYSQLLDVNKLDENASVKVYSSNPYVYMFVETEDPGAEVSIPNSKYIDGGYLLKLDSNKDDSIPINIVPANKDLMNQGQYSIKINWEITEATLEDLQISGGKLTKPYKKNAKEYCLVPDSFDSKVSINYIPGKESNIEVYLNRLDSKPIEVSNNTIEVDPSKIHQVIFKVTALDGTTNNYIIAIERERSKDTSGEYSKTVEKASQLLNKSIEGYKEEQGKKMNKAYWGTFTMTGAGESLDGYYVYDVTNHNLKQGTDYAAIILQLVMIGENPYNYCGVNYVEGLKNCKDEIGSYGPYACNIWALYALDAAGYYDPELLNRVSEQAVDKNFDLDMRSWAIAAIQNHLDVEGMAEKSAVATERMKLYQYGTGINTAGFQNNFYPDGNMCSHACAIMALTSAGVNLEDEDWKVDGVSPIDAIAKRQTEDGKLWEIDFGGRYMESYNEQLMIALGGILNRSNVWIDQVLTLDKVEKLLNKAKEIKADKAIQDQIDEKVAKLQGLYDNNSGNALGMGEDYYALYDLVGLADESFKLDTFMGTEEEKAEVEAVINQIGEISEIEKLTYADKAKVEAAKSAYDRLKRVRVEGKSESTLLQHYVENSYILDEATKFIENEEKANKEKAEELTSAILKYKDVDSIKLEDKGRIEELKNQVNSLSKEVSALLTSETLDVLNAAVERITNLEAATPVILEIEKLEEGVTLLDGPFLKEVRAMYDSLTKTQKALVKNYSLLVSSEKEFSKLQVENVINQIKLLPEPSDLKKVLNGKVEETTITPKQIEQIAKAKATYDELKPEQHAIIEALEDGAALINKLSEDALIVEDYEGYIEAYLKPLIEKIKNFELPMNANQVGYAKEIVDGYDKNENSKTYLDSFPGIKDKIADIKKGIESWNKASKEADTVRKYFNEAMEASQENLISRDTVQAIKEALEKYEALKEKSEKAASLLENEISSIEGLKDKIYAKKKQLNEENKIARILGDIPWDVELEIKDVEGNKYDLLKSYLTKYKDASIVKAVSIKGSEIMSDGSLKEYIPESDYQATLFTHEDFSNKNVYVASLGSEGVNVLNNSISGSDVTFTLEGCDGEYAIGVKAVKKVEQTDDKITGGNGGKDANNNDSKPGNDNKLQSSNGGKKVNDSSDNSSGKYSSVPKTGDTIPMRMVMMMVVITVGCTIFIGAKRYKTANR